MANKNGASKNQTTKIGQPKINWQTKMRSNHWKSAARNRFKYDGGGAKCGLMARGPGQMRLDEKGRGLLLSIH